MPPEPNTLSYFLVVLGGFGAVWSFRLLTGKSVKKLGEFEYAAFSTIWGISVFVTFMWLQRDNSKLAELIQTMNDMPMVVTPALFILGAFLGAIAAGVLVGIKFLWHRYRYF